MSKNIYELLGEDHGEEVVAPSKKPQPSQAKQPVATTATKGKDNKKVTPVLPPSNQSQKENTSRKDKAPSTSNKTLPAKKTKEVPESGEKRVFERKSGTGRAKNENKKSGSGKGNWGNIDEPVDVAQTTQETPVSDTKEDQTNQDQKQPEQPVEPKEEDKTLTLEEYKKQQQKAHKLPKISKARQSGEGVDNSAWKEFVPLVRTGDGGLLVKKQKKEDESKETKEGKETESKQQQPAKKETERVPVHEVLNIQTKQPSRGRGRGGRNRGGEGRGGEPREPREPREGGRGGRGGNFRGSFRGRRGGAQFSFNEENFPALTTKA